ncbi:MAG: hypothetical protein CVU56_20005 [Deltaproteobacteria bacterium HGW-Deltaproteobacteria-14]|nr:MAG: hypothetical protein CVU56_20005 [Deltaproteobacteria bacterium HGW-Deltaproteobacteria-14]
MKLFIESASHEAVADVVDVGVVDGVVLGPSASRQGAKGLRAIVDALLDLAVGPVVIEVEASEVEASLVRARELAAMGDEVVCGVALSREGLEVCRTCFDEGIATCVGPCVTVAQALLAAKAGATWISVDVGATEAAGGDGVKLAEDVAALLTDCDFEAQLLAIGLRNAQHVGELALAGAHSALVTPEVLWALVGPRASGVRVASTPRRPRRR